ncbi:MAG: DUF1640 domain-containing protein [Nitrospirae bacterium]|nr:DUF1640 domain-containing protein [Nitrospirota bacterium]
MATLTFDTLRFANRLKSAGVLPAQAEAEAEALSEAFEVNLKDIATKGDLRELELRVDARFERVDGELKLLKWMLGVVIGGVIALVMKAFFAG